MRPAQPDLTGRDRIASNVLTSWAAHLVFVVAGFVMPRLIDGTLGQRALGVWDFSWSLVAYFSLVVMGLVSSVNRYVAKYRAAGDMAGVNRVVSSVTVVLVVMSLVITGLAGGVSLATPSLFGGRLGAFSHQAQWVIFLLGLSLAVQVAFSGFGGALTGYHHWGVHNLIFAANHAACVGCMIVVLVLGGGLVGLAAVNLCAEVVGWLVRCVATYRLCPGLSVRVRLAEWRTTRRLFSFGGRTFVPRLADLLANQTVSVLIMASLGPAALALFTRPRSLLHHAQTLVTKFAMVLIPTASSLDATGADHRLARFLIAAGKYGAYVTLPIIAVLTILGGPLLRLWMGPNYALGALAAALALGQLALILAIPAVYVLTGLNAHGRPGLANFIASVIGAALAALALGPLRLGLVGAALGIGIPLTIANGIYVPIYACRKVRLSLGHYLRAAFVGPVACAVPFALCLCLGRLIFAGSPLPAVLSGGGAGAVVLGILYWLTALPESARNRITGLLRLGPSRKPGLVR